MSTPVLSGLQAGQRSRVAWPRRREGQALAAGATLVVGGGAVDIALHVATDLLGVTDPRAFGAEYAGHLVILLGMTIALGGVIGRGLRHSTH